MPTLHWIGKDDVVKHQQDVPTRLLEPMPALSCSATAKRHSRECCQHGQR